jgi:23S rRNA-/tRNA-specific pseudouridylate synthase
MWRPTLDSLSTTTIPPNSQKVFLSLRISAVAQRADNMPQGYTLHQVFYQNIQLIAVNKPLGVQALPGNQYFAILEDLWCEMGRPGHPNWRFSTTL